MISDDPLGKRIGQIHRKTIRAKLDESGTDVISFSAEPCATREPHRLEQEAREQGRGL